MAAPTEIDPYDARDKVVSYKVKSIWIVMGFGQDWEAFSLDCLQEIQ